MFKSKKRVKEQELDDKIAKKLDTAAYQAVKEAKKTQDVIIANGFTLELLTAFSGGKHE